MRVGLFLKLHFWVLHHELADPLLLDCLPCWFASLAVCVCFFLFVRVLPACSLCVSSLAGIFSVSLICNILFVYMCFLISPALCL